MPPPGWADQDSRGGVLKEQTAMTVPQYILDGIQRLDPLPLTVQKLVLMLDDEEVNFVEVAEVIEYDGAITSNVLRAANSAAFGGLCYIREIRDAVVRLGTATLLDIMLIGHLRSMRASAPQYNLSEDELWLHGAAASLAAKAIIKEARTARVPPVATVAALIHDIGKLIMVRYMRADMPSLFEVCQERAVTLVEAERQVLECDHPEVGSLMARKWAFPESIIQAIEYHHEPPSGISEPVLDTVMLANAVAKFVGGGNGLTEDAADPGPAELSRRLSLRANAFGRICEHTAAWLADLQKSYGVRN